MEKVKKYVLGFAFTPDAEHVVLIEKQKPDWQKGKLNGVGGKVEESDISDKAAMVREFKEETGLETSGLDWHHFATMVFKNDVMGGEAHVYCYRMFTNRIYHCQTCEIEKIGHYATNLRHVNDSMPYYYTQNIIKNIRVLIPMAMDKDFQFATLNIL